MVMVMSLLIALGFGATLPLPGNLYPPGDGWRARDYQKVFGHGAILSAITLAGLILLGAWAKEGLADQFLVQITWTWLFVGKPLLLFDTLVALAPFEGFNSRHLRDFHRPAWILLSAVAIALFIWA